ncbi:MAG: hypothetical protein U0003_05830 [Vampirovibrionales bacterium]
MATPEHFAPQATVRPRGSASPSRHTLRRLQRTSPSAYAQPTWIDQLVEMLEACQELIENVARSRNDSTFSHQWFDGAIWLLESVGLIQKGPTEPEENALILHPKRGLVRGSHHTNIWRDNFKLVDGRKAQSARAHPRSYSFESTLYE